MKHAAIKGIFACGLAVLGLGVAQAQPSQYDVVTSSQALAASDVLNNLDFSNPAAKPAGARNAVPGAGTSAAAYNVPSVGQANVDMYTNEQMDTMIEGHLLEAVVFRQDRCQFVPDIEDRARIVNIPAFQFAWGEMLIRGICVKKDELLGVEYIKKAADNSYAPAMERIAFYYEKGYYVVKDERKSERYMHTAAALGSKTGRLGWADMLVRGYGSPQLYEEAFSWLYHSTYTDPYSQDKQKFLQEELGKRMPPNVVARNMAFDYGM